MSVSTFLKQFTRTLLPEIAPAVEVEVSTRVPVPAAMVIVRDAVVVELNRIKLVLSPALGR